MYFKVKSQTDPGQKGGYKVSVDIEYRMPSCECHSWVWNLHPCKHIFAVKNSTNASWGICHNITDPHNILPST